MRSIAFKPIGQLDRRLRTAASRCCRRRRGKRTFWHCRYCSDSASDALRSCATDGLDCEKRETMTHVREPAGWTAAVFVICVAKFEAARVALCLVQVARSQHAFTAVGYCEWLPSGSGLRLLEAPTRRRPVPVARARRCAMAEE